MSPRALVRLAMLGEGVLVVVAWGWARLADIPFSFGHPGTGIGWGLVMAAVMAVVNGWLLCRAPALAPVQSVRRLYVTTLKPMFGRVGPTEIAVISLAAGCGEELFFRGVLVPQIGLVGSSLVFGLLHTGGRDSWAFGVWAALMGGGLGLLMQWTGGLVAPVVAHAVYDAAAMSYIRWGRDCAAVAER